MGLTYTIKNQEGQYFITCTVHQWIDVFTKEVYKEILLDSIRHCQENKGLQVYGWVLMTNHIHMIISSNKNKLTDIIRDFKKYTATKIVDAIANNATESRKNWLLWLLKNDNEINFWQEGYHGEEIFTLEFFETKLNYMHQNPVKAGIVEKEEEYLYSSCGDYYGIRKGKLDLIIEYGI
ncbi:REP-associated tyrosine transposase [Pedobacter cryotolerans]|uniref:Transposase n=1 Tax=Pedobacter cryotolerans TaxID=2571270 RepID=A0A4U1C9J1_9SPHI|nr:transposase [Pedobacter cryotolerans]TKC03159.1 transposase [Pedobacter cryotolerans]